MKDNNGTSKTTTTKSQNNFVPTVVDGVDIVSKNTTATATVTSILTTNHSKMKRYSMERKEAVGEEGGYHALHHVASYHLVEKAVEINLILNEPEIDLWRLRELAISEGGLVNDAIRRRAWPKLVGLHNQQLDDDKFNRNKEKKTSQRCTTNEDNSKKSNAKQSSTNRSKKRPLVQVPTNNTGSFVLGESDHDKATSFNVDLNQSQIDNNHQRGNGKEQSDNNVDSSVSVVSRGLNVDVDLLQSRDDNSDAGSQHNYASSDNNSTGVGSNSSSRISVIVQSLDFTQIELDCKRCTWHLLTGSQRVQRLQMENKRNTKIAKLIKRKQRRLSNLINYTLTKSYLNNNNKLDPTGQSNDDQSAFLYGKEEKSSQDRNLEMSIGQYQRYYQGYHDVACIFLSSLSGLTSANIADTRHPSYYLRSSSSNSDMKVHELARASKLDLAANVLFQLSQSHFPDYLKSNFWDLQTIMRLTIIPLLAYFDNTVYNHFIACEMDLPFFALSWILTWFSHEIRDTELVKRIFDFFIVSHPLMPIYVSVAMILHPYNRVDVLNTECDFSELHHLLSTLPRNSSMVGWKYRPGDGYVSDDAEEEDDDEQQNGTGSSKFGDDSSISIDADSFVFINETWAGSQQKTESVSVVSTSLSSNAESRVPFQELITLALQFIEQVPPRLLMKLACRHYTSGQLHEILQPLAEHHKVLLPSATELTKNPEAAIAMCLVNSRMFDSPSWARKHKCNSDTRTNATVDNFQNPNEPTPTQKLRQRKRDIEKSVHSKVADVGLLKSSKSDESLNDIAVNDEDLCKYLEEKSTLAKIAAGFSSDKDIEKGRSRKTTMTICKSVGVAIAVVSVAVIAGIFVQQNFHRMRNLNVTTVKPGGSTKIIDGCEVTEYTTSTGSPASIIYNNEIHVVPEINNEIHAVTETISNTVEAIAPLQSRIFPFADTMKMDVSVPEIESAKNVVTNQVVEAPKKIFFEAPKKKMSSKLVESEKSKLLLLLNSHKLQALKHNENQQLRLIESLDSQQSFPFDSHSVHSINTKTWNPPRTTVTHLHFFVQLADSSVSLLVRDFIKALTKNPITQKMDSFKKTQLANSARVLIHNALIQNTWAKSRKTSNLR